MPTFSLFGSRGLVVCLLALAACFGCAEPVWGASNTLLTWGADESSKLGLGTKGDNVNFPFPQPVAVMSNVEQIAAAGGGSPLALTKDGRIWAWGINSGNGKRGEVQVTPAVVTGGKAIRPEGPVGPTLYNEAEGVLIPIRSVEAGSGADFAVTSEGKVLAWGEATQGQLGNGYTSSIVPGQGQYAPFWVLTGAPAQEVAAGEANVLKGVKQVSVGFSCTVFLMESGEVYLAGRPAGFGESSFAYAKPDPVFVTGKHEWEEAHKEPFNKPVEVAASHSGYLLRLEDGQVAYVGNNSKGIAGNGEAESLKTNERTLSIVEKSHGEALENVVGVAIGEYAAMALDSSGHVWSWGANNNDQLGLGEPKVREGETVFKVWATEIPSLEHVKEVSMGSGLEGLGGTSGDDAIARVENTEHGDEVRTWGNNYTYTGETYGWSGTGALGDSTFEDRSSPVNPGISHVVGISASGDSMFVIQSEGAIGEPRIRTSYSAGKLTVEWRPFETGTPPQWRAPEGWAVTVHPEGAGSTYKSKSSEITSSPPWLVWTHTVAGGEKYEVKVEEELQAEYLLTSETPLKGESPNRPLGTVFEGSGGKLPTITWEEPKTSEPAFVVEGRRIETFPAGDPEVKLSETLSTGSAITSVPVNAVSESAAPGFPAGARVTALSGAHQQTFTLTKAAVKGDKTLSVASQTPNYPYPKGDELIGAPVLEKALSTSGKTNKLLVEALEETYGNNALVTLRSGSHEQTFKLNHAASPKEKATLEVDEVEANYAYPAGTAVILSSQEPWQRLTEVPGTAREVTPAIPFSGKELTGETLEVRLKGIFEGAFKKRAVQIEL
jgi:alpha-tubulin suppressor-like RCC1 family protein